MIASRRLMEADVGRQCIQDAAREDDHHVNKCCWLQGLNKPKCSIPVFSGPERRQPSQHTHLQQNNRRIVVTLPANCRMCRDGVPLGADVDTDLR
jgi:hypothetical protein